MGKLDSTGTLAQTRGRQGGLVVSSNQSGSYTRAWFMPRNPRTVAQLEWARKWQAWCKAWNVLTDVQRAAWNAASLDAVWTKADWFGQEYQPTGLNLWLMIAALRDALSLELSSTPPSGVAPVREITASMDLTLRDPVTYAHLCFVTAVQGAEPVWTYLQIEAAWLISADGSARNKPFRPLVAVEFASSELIDCTPRTNETIGWIYNETRCWFRWRGWTDDLIPGPWAEAYGTTGLD